MTETTISGGGGTGGVYTPPPADDQVDAPKTAGVAPPQADPNLTVTYQGGQNTANLASDQIGSEDLEPPMTMGDLSLTVTILFADLNQTRANQNVDMLKDAGKEIKQSNKHRLEQIQKNADLIAKHKKKEKGMLIGQICGMVGGVLIAAASLGTMSGVGVALVVASVAISTATQVTQMAGGFEALAKATDSKTAQGVMYGALAVSVVLGVGGGAASALQSAPEVAETLAQTAAETGVAMSEASTPAQAAEALAEGIQEMTTTLEQAGVEVDQVTVQVEPAAAFSQDAGNVAEAGADATASGVIDDAAANASDVVKVAGNADDATEAAKTADDLAEGIDDTGDVAKQAKAPKDSDAPDVDSDEGVEGQGTDQGDSNWDKLAKAGHRTGRLMEFGADVEQAEVKVETAGIERDQHRTQSSIQKDDAYIQFERDSMQDGSDSNKNTLDQLSGSFQFMNHFNNSIRTQAAAPIGAIGRDGTA